MSQLPPPPGRFQISINGQLMSFRFGKLEQAIEAAPPSTAVQFVEIFDGWTRQVVHQHRDY